MKRREILIIGTSAPVSWANATCGSPKNQDILKHLEIGILIAAVNETKVKAFGYDEEGKLKSKCWTLPKDYSTVADKDVFEELKLVEAEVILKQYFKEMSVDIKILQSNTVAAGSMYYTLNRRVSAFQGLFCFFLKNIDKT